MKILLAGTYSPDRQQSMLRFSPMLEVGLQEAGHTPRTIRPEPCLARAGAGRRGLNKWFGYVDKFLLFPARLRNACGWADIVHIIDHSYSLYTRHLNNMPHVVTCHDLIAVRCAKGEFPGQYVRWSGRRYQEIVVSGLERARRVACDSESTRADLVRLCRLPVCRTSTIHLALNFAYRPMSTTEKAARCRRYGISTGEGFFLHVGSGNWYKNRPGVIRIFRHLAANSEMNGFRLLMITDGWTPALRSVVKECGLEDRVHLLSDVDNVDLCALYSSAVALLFPSLYEGFGWPIIEAQACGCPVFTSNRPPMTEVAGSGAVFVDPEDPKEAANTILQSLPHIGLMREAGFANVRRFSTERMIEGYLNLYKTAGAFNSQDEPTPVQASARIDAADPGFGRT